VRLPPIWARIPLTALAVYTAYVGVACSLQNQLVFPGPAHPPPMRAPDPLPLAGERLSVPVADGEVEAWFIPGAGVSAASPGPVVLFAHGNAETIDDWAMMLDDYVDFGVSMLLIEYRGYGRSAGEPTQEGVIADAVAFYDQLVARPDVDKDRIVLHGRSVGSGVVCALSRVRPARLLVLQSAFSRLGKLSWRFGVPPFVVQDEFDNVGAVRAFPGRVLLIHGRQDPLFPFDHAEELRAASPRARLQPMHCEHNDCPPQLFITIVREQMAEVGVIAPLTDEQRLARRFLRPKEDLR
jgi:pimeloyl-ACP methyl ester carboxylesterase